MEEKRFFTPLTLLLCALLLAAAGALYFFLSLTPQGTVAILERDGQVLWERDLSQLTEPETLSVQGEDGIQLTVTLSPQGAEISSSPCPDHVCVQTGTLTRAGETALCLPARVSLRLEGGGNGVDATVY